MPQKIDIMKLLDQNESETLEFKGAAPGFKRIAKSLTAFANTNGGLLVLGVDSELRKVIGLNSEFSINLIEEICEKLIRPVLKPKFTELSYQDMNVICIKVNKANETHSVKGDNNIYYRKNDKTEIKIS
ncbi:ATP-binding protein [bacterium]|nr:ATP-binding protein [bacterium]